MADMGKGKVNIEIYAFLCSEVTFLCADKDCIQFASLNWLVVILHIRFFPFVM
jgi:hypothetical protein